jgi:poly(A) polymerase Pap1
MKLTKEMIDCLKTRLQKPGVCTDCPLSETIVRRKIDNHCIVSVMCDDWLDEQEEH